MTPSGFRDINTNDPDVIKIKNLTKALENIKEYGYKNPGCGYSCARMAEEALSSVKEK